MAIRITGLNSGMDTESIISQLVSAKKTSVNSIKKAQIKLSWKIDAWKNLNSKIYSLYTGVADKMRWDSAYNKKKTSVSTSGLVSVVAGADAANGTQTIAVEKLAKAAYLTGGKISAKGGAEVKGDTKLQDLQIDPGSSFSITTGGKKSTFTITEDNTINDLVSWLKGAGVNANFDEGQQRLFVNAKETGKDSDFSFSGHQYALKKLGLIEDSNNPNGAVKIDGDNSVMYLNGAKFESSNNTMVVNGSTYTLESVSERDADNKLKESTLTTTDDYDGIYNTIKNFLTEYNKLIIEMDKLYNASSSKGYDPLLSEEKEALSDSEVSDWEKKIKDSLLRKDSSLGSLISGMTTAMSKGFEVGGKTMYLANFGVATLGYFNSEENERHAFHIDGDPDDSNTSGKTDILKSMIASDPNTVKSFFTQLSNELYGAMTKSMSRVSGYKSMYKVYNDQQMDTELKSYNSKIADAEDKLAAYEDKWYKKFGAMETALAKLSSKQNALAGLFGNNY